MVAMTITLMIVGTIYGLLNAGRRMREVTARRSDAQSGARLAMIFMRRDAINAGLGFHQVGGLAPDNFVTKLLQISGPTARRDDNITGIFMGDNVNLNTLGTGSQTDAIGFATRDLTFNNGNTFTWQSSVLNSNKLEITTLPGQAANCRVNDLYLIESDTSQSIIMATEVSGNKIIAGNDPLQLNNFSTVGTGSYPFANLTNVRYPGKKILLTTYYVTPNGVLMRRTYGNNGTGQVVTNQVFERELIYGVGDLQFTYLLDDGTRTSNPITTLNTTPSFAAMNRVIQLEITISVLEDPAKPVGTDNKFVTMTETISTRNLHYTDS